MAKKKAKGSGARDQGCEWIAEDLRALAVPLGDLTLDPQNARKHGEANLRAIERSLRQFGQLKPIVVQRGTGIIEAGNGLFLSAQKLGWSHLAVVWVEHDLSSQRGFAIADNRTAELAEWDDAVLAELIDDLEEETPDLFADLLLGELLPEDKGSAAGGEDLPGTFQVIVDCKDEDDQKALSEQLQKKGRNCRLLTS